MVRVGRFHVCMTAVTSALGVSCPPAVSDAPPVVVTVPPPISSEPEPEPEPVAVPASAPAPAPAAVPAPTFDLASFDRDTAPSAAAADDEPESAPAPEPPPPPTPAPAPAPPRLASIAKETWIFSAPRWKARRIGYLRAGATVARSRAPAGREGCPDGWYRIEPRGYVCVGATATLDLSNPVVELASSRADRSAPYPYAYVMSRHPTPPFYVRVPTREQQRKVEPDLDAHLAKAKRLEAASIATTEMPAALREGRQVPVLGGPARGADLVARGRAVARSGFALLEAFESEGRTFGLTTDFDLVPIDRARVLSPSAFHGVALGDEITLPMAFVRARHASRYTIERGVATPDRPLAFREAVPVTGKVVRARGADWLEAVDGTFVREDAVVLVDRMREAPGWATPGRKWIDVSILRQSLVAYEGTRPVYVTLVSTGVDGLGDPATTHSTVLGAFLVHTKHVSATMDSDAAEDEFDLRDVPYVQYFHDGYALHAAYWHDDFGNPHSHGCVNLAPFDAAWLFEWTDPQVPEGWHAALSLKNGTLVYTHP